MSEDVPMKKIILQVLADMLNNIYFENTYSIKTINNKHYLFKFCHDKGIASMNIYKYLLIFNFPMIEVTDEFYTFDKDEQEFILQHEVAHYKLKHYRWYYMDHFLTDAELNELEKEADLLATMHTSKEIAMKSLTNLEKYLDENEIDSSSIRERITFIEGIKIKERA
jgi:Zn-dependent protease with chaperone function